VTLTVHLRYYVEIKCHLDATNDFYCNHLYNTLQLLMMGIMVPETCWASNKICNKNHMLHLVGILFPHNRTWSSVVVFTLRPHCVPSMNYLNLILSFYTWYFLMQPHQNFVPVPRISVLLTWSSQNFLLYFIIVVLVSDINPLAPEFSFKF
jgi:hypothetical protein